MKRNAAYVAAAFGMAAALAVGILWATLCAWLGVAGGVE